MRGVRSLRLRAAAGIAGAALVVSIGPLSAEPRPPKSGLRAAGPRADVAERVRSEALRTSRTVSPSPSVAASNGASDLARRIRARLDGRAGEGRRPRDRDSGGRATSGTTGVSRVEGVATPRQIRGARTGPPASSQGTRVERDTATARRLLRERRGLLRLRDPDSELRVTRADVDALGCCQVRFAQTYRGLDVWASELVVQVAASGDADLVSGAFVPTPRRVVTRPTIRSSRAAQIARQTAAPARDAAISEPRLLVHVSDTRLARLAWSVVVTVSDAERLRIFVDAHTGRVLEQFDEVAHEDVAGSGVDLLGATRPLHVWHAGATFSMTDTSKPMFDVTSNPPSPGGTRGGIVVLDAAGDGPEGLSASLVTSSNPASWALRDAVSASFGLSQTYDYFLERHGRNSLDGDGGTMLAVVRVGSNFANAFWNGQYMAFGDAEPYAASLDVVGHELTHGVTERTAGLVYLDESGALNEAMSDIFGEMVELRTTGGQHDWRVGTKLSAALRDMRDPSSVEIQPGLPFPDRMSRFIATSQDNGGVHLNSSIINRAFYLLAEGLPNAAGVAKAERIFFRTLATKLVPRSRFVDCRLGAIAAAGELFGAESPEVLATTAAFDTVEIFDAAPTPVPLPAPAIDGTDATLFVYFDANAGAVLLGRRETALGDGALGTPLSVFPVAGSRPSVSADGSVAVFVDDASDVCVVDTDGSDTETCLGFTGSVHSVAMSPDRSKFAFVLQDASGDPLSSITVTDLTGGTDRTFPLAAPLFDGGQVEVLLADSMEFSRDGSVLLYDAFNVISFGDGSQLGAWSIYALDLATETVFTVVEPTPGLDIGSPSLAHTTDRFLVFEAVDPEAGDTTVVARDLYGGELAAVVTIEDATILAAPSFTGDDRAIVFAVPDANATGASLLLQDLAADGISPSGQLKSWLEDAAYAVTYRRGEVPQVPPPAETELTFVSGVPRLETLDLDIPVAAASVPVRLALAHDVSGKFTAGGTCTAGGAPVTVSGALGIDRRSGSFVYALTLRSASPKTQVTVRGVVGAATAVATYKGLEGSAKNVTVAATASAYLPTSRLRIRAAIDFRGRIAGTASIVGGFGNDGPRLAALTGSVRGALVKLTLKDPAARRKLTFQGLVEGDEIPGRLSFKLPPAGGSVEFAVPVSAFGF